MTAQERLKRYATFSKPAALLPQHMTNILAHWTIGADPESYDYRAVRAAVDQATSVEGMSSRDYQRHFKAQKKAQRSLERQRRENMRIKQAEAASSQAPMIVARQDPVSRSSPAPISRPMGIQSSQAPPQSQSQNRGVMPFVATQVERGPYGGRPAVPKKRKIGFK